jgi:hypothetical protein
MHMFARLTPERVLESKKKAYFDTTSQAGPGESVGAVETAKKGYVLFGQ